MVPSNARNACVSVIGLMNARMMLPISIDLQEQQSLRIQICSQSINSKLVLKVLECMMVIRNVAL